MPPSAFFFGNDSSSRSRVRTRLITKASTTNERVTHLHIRVPAITRGTLARTHELKTEMRYVCDRFYAKLDEKANHRH